VAHALPFRPHPFIPDEDRTSLRRDALVSLAVVLDVLATRTRRIEATRTLLTQLTAVLLDVGLLGGLDGSAIRRLLDHAANHVGHSRAALTRHLCECMFLAGRSADSDQETSAASTPRAAGRALRRLEAAAQVVIQEATLRLEAQEGVEYRQV
jgi:hypothetical protein